MGRRAKKKKLLRWNAARVRYEVKRRRSRPRRLARYKNSLEPVAIQRKARLPRYKAKVLPAPRIFSLIKNADEVLKYFETAENWLRSGHEVSFDLSNVSEVTPDGIALLIAKVRHKPFRHRRAIGGIAPNDPMAARMFEESGFYSHVKPSRLITASAQHLLLHRVTRNKVENEQAKQAGKLASAHLFGDGRKIRQVYEVLIECMANTNNHADRRRRGVYDWWLFVYNSPTEKRTIFTFLDMGIGIFKSLQARKFWWDAILSLGLSTNVSILEKMTAGKVASRTKKPERGKGLPRIQEHASGGIFSNFMLMSEDVSANLVESRYKSLKYPMQGTFFTFEIFNPDVLK